MLRIMQRNIAYISLLAITTFVYNYVVFIFNTILFE